MPLALTFGAGDVRVLEQRTAWSGHFAIRQLTLQHRLFAGGWSEPLVREVSRFRQRALARSSRMANSRQSCATPVVVGNTS